MEALFPEASVATEEDFEDRMDVTVVGFVLGTCSGWDEVTEDGLMFYDFEPLKGLDLPSDDLYIDLVSGSIETYDEIGEVSYTTLFSALIPHLIKVH